MPRDRQTLDAPPTPAAGVPHPPPMGGSRTVEETEAESQRLAAEAASKKES